MQVQFSSSTRNLHVFDNAAFSDEEDEGEAKDSSMAVRGVSWSSPKSQQLSDSFLSNEYKENTSPKSHLNFSPAKTKKPLMPLHPISVNTNKNVLQPKNNVGFSSPAKICSKNDEISAGIEEIENEIRRLKGKLSELKLKQAMNAGGDETKNSELDFVVQDLTDRRQSVAGKRGRTIPAKFMEFTMKCGGRDLGPLDSTQKNRRKSCFIKFPIEEDDDEGEIGSRSLSLSPRKNRPPILKSVGFSTVGAKIPIKKSDSTALSQPKVLFHENNPTVTGRKSMGVISAKPKPSLDNVNRRKSCYVKFPLDENDATKKKKSRKSLSVSPKKSQPSIAKKPCFSTIDSKKPAKRDGLSRTIQPKSLFRQDVITGKDKPSSSRINLKNGRVIASRYNQNFPSTVNDIPSKRLTEIRKEDVKVETTSKSSILRNEEQSNNQRKRWSVYPLSPVTAMTQKIPKIKVIRSTVVSPRDSGRVKRASEMVGHRSYFAEAVAEVDDEVDGVRLTAFSFDEEQ